MGIKIGQYKRYLHGDMLNELVKLSEERLAGKDFDTIAVCGISGLLVGAPLATVMGKSLLIVRKPTEVTRSGYEVERLLKMFGNFGKSDIDIQRLHGILGNGNNQKILLLDDQVSTGATLNLMVDAIHKGCSNATFTGVFLYTQHELVPSWYLSLFERKLSKPILRAGEPLELPLFTLSY